MGGDLNQKKSWHPALLKNQARVHDAETQALAERKKTEARLEEIRQERQQEEIEKQLEAAGGRAANKTRGLEWMYQGGVANGAVADEYGSEAFLLGKRRIDTLLKDNEVKKLERQAAAPEASALPLSNTRDIASKLREDPLMAIKKQEQAAYEALLKDPLKRAQLLASMGVPDETHNHSSKRKEDRDRKHRHRHRHRHREDDSDYERRHKRRRSDSRDDTRSRRRQDSEDEDREERHRKRRRSPEERRRYESEDSDRDHRDHERDRDRRGHRRDANGSRRGRSSSPRRDYADDDRRDRRRDRDEDRRKRYDSAISDDGGPRRDKDGSRDHRDSRDGRRDDHRKDGRSGFNGHSRQPYRPDRPRHNGTPQVSNNENDDEERARKLAAMQEAASDLDQAREARLAEMAERDQAERDADNRAREKSSKYGGDREFVNSLHRTAGSQSLADRLGRGRQGFQMDND